MAEKALYFDGVDDKVEATSAFGDIDFKGQAFTIEFWAKLTSAANVLVQLDAATGTNFGITVAKDATTNIFYLIFNRTDYDGTGRTSVYTANLSALITITDWNWFHITYDGSGTPDTDTVKIYVNNVDRTSATVVTIAEFAQTNTIRLGINGQGTWDLTGTLDEIRISDIVRSEADRNAAWNGGAGAELSSDANTIWLVHLNDETSPTDDASGYSNDGTVTGASWVDGMWPPVPKTSSDTGQGVEALLSRALVLPEVGTGLESLGSRLLGAIEEGGGVEVLLARLMVSTETATGLDVGGLFFTSNDVGSGLDAILALEARLTGADSGSGIDTAFLIKALLSTDSGLGTEAVAALLAGIVAGELMVGSDRLVVKIESAPTGGGMSLPPGGKTSIPSRRVNL